MLRHSVVVVGMIAFSASSVGAQRSTRPQDPPGITTLLTIDSTQVLDANVSPDGKWLVFSRAGADRVTSSIWIAGMGEKRPIRLTTDGYTDRTPTVSPAGDRVFFVSNRPSRDAKSAATFVMSIPIDKAAAHPTGPVRQVTTDSVHGISAIGVSGDGKWLTYTLAGPPPSVRVVSTSGGNARTLATKGTYQTIQATFSADGKSVVFGDSGTKFLKEVAVAGGPVTTIATGGAGYVNAFPLRSDRFLFFPPFTANTVMEADVRDLAGQTYGIARVPPGDRHSVAIRADGRGLISFKNEDWRGLKRVSLTTGIADDLLSPGPGWPFGLMANGSILASRTVGDRVVLFTYSSSGKLISDVTIGPGVKDIAGLLPGGSRLLAVGPGYPNPPIIKNQYGRNAPRTRMPAFVVDRSTGAVHKLADSVLTSCCPRNWGADEDATGIAELRGTMVDVKLIDATGRTHLVRSFPVATFERVEDVAIHGARLAYAEPTDDKQWNLFVTTDLEGAPSRIGAVSSSADVALAWSPDGQRLAVAFDDAANNDRPTARVFEIAADGLVTSSGVALDLGGTTDYFENIAWLPDASALLVMRDDHNDKTCINCVIVRSLDPARPPVRLAPELGSVGSFFVEPGGKSVLVEVDGSGGGSIWSTEFVPVKKP